MVLSFLYNGVSEEERRLLNDRDTSHELLCGVP